MRKVRVEPRFLKQCYESRFTKVDPQARFVGVGVDRRGPSARIATTLISVAASSVAQGRAGTVDARRSTIITGVTAEAFAVIEDGGYVTSSPHIPGIHATSVTESFAGTVSTNWNANIFGQMSISVATPGVGVVSAAGNIRVQGPGVTNTSEANTGDVSAIRNVNAEGPVSTVIGLAPQGSVSTDTVISGVVAEATVDAPAGVWSDAINADIHGEPITNTVDTFAGGVSIGRGVPGVVATSSASAHPGVVVAGLSTQVNGFVADATAITYPGLVQPVRNVNISGVVAAGAASAHAGSVTAIKNFSTQRLNKNGDSSVVGIIPNWTPDATAPAVANGSHQLVVQGSKTNATYTAVVWAQGAFGNTITLTMYRNGVEITTPVNVTTDNTYRSYTLTWVGDANAGDVVDVRATAGFQTALIRGAGTYLEVA